jgi:imidazoleglycerol-phosphate dehydratase
LTLNITILSGDDFHHTIEAAFKGLGRAMEAATRLNPRVLGVPSSKGSL